MNTSKPKASQAPHTAAIKQVRDYINRYAKQGWWPYRPEKEPSTEATAWCTLSLNAQDPKLPAALQFLVKSQNEDGGWSTAPKEGKSDWCTGPALFAVRSAALLLGDTKSKSTYERGITYLDQAPAEIYGFGARVLLGAIQGVDKVEEQPRGWPWSPGCFHWVEPTSYNLFAFKCPERSTYKGGSKEVVERANKFLLENSCSIGGWNHGSHFSLGTHLPPYIVTTAEALLALQDFPNHKVVQQGFEFLDANTTEASKAGQQKSAMALAWMTLANHAYGRETDKLLTQLVAGQNADGSFGPNMMVTALSAMALATADGVNPFKMRNLDTTKEKT